ncbi:Acyl transferase domain-containing protein [Flavobacterium sp. CF108]|uniref:type I polyketide synthase n=1 Tax=unclassified Flavobacterium TaxID=196869 RepID=UPI0008D0E1A9|nr:MULTISPECIES: type I polyketide synthase [unclassified Flavobacterium]SEO94974.1 Alcohol dehydrogenase GroES-like domain-containing protein [Flavobacterium sp. fv08]SHH82359.1 Acyl transferase domain-containing protein [Flavobacterium sp. CF108]
MKDQNKPIAIVGIGCRFPGSSSSPEKFWEMLLNKTDAVIDVPSNRWDNRRFYDENEKKAGKIKAKQGGFLKEEIEYFDPMFFGISPVEAESLDPQERILLEVAYEALEDAGMSLEQLRGSDTGVFVGGFTFDNYLLKTAAENKHLINSHTALGISLTMLSNRLSYFLDLKGPSITIDTACSSSLVATHYACQSIWRGESSMALVGGVNLLLKPEVSLVMSKGQFLSKHSRCKTFDSDAAGYVRGEGGGVVVLKPYEQAVKDGDQIYALINGTGVNQDGNTNGITVPNKNSQMQLIQKVYEESGVTKKDIHYVEAHGTGTAVGDVIEFSALNESLFDDRDKCLVGSVKTNIGHLEAASGVAGLIKTALSLKNNAVPANLHFNIPNPALNYENSILKVPTLLEKLPEGVDSYASINSFGYGGTNAHAVLKQFSSSKEEVQYDLEKKDHFIFPICARSKNALKELVSKYKSHIEDKDKNFAQILSNAIYRRSLHSDRLAIVASSKEELIEKIEAFEEDILVKGVTAGNILDKKPNIVFVYTGMGPQWWKMGRELIEKEPVFYKAVQECDDYFKIISGWSILEELQKPEETSNIKETSIAQPANFVIQVALTRLLEHYGINADAVVGHSVGEVTSAYISGALSLQDALLVSYNRSRLQHKTAGKGTMLAVGLSEKEANETFKEFKDVSIAAINSLDSVTLAGNQESLEKLIEKYESSGIFHRLLDVEVPYHSPVMDLIEDELLESLKELKGKETVIDLYSTVTAEKISGEQINNDYWWKNVRQPVLFAKTMDSLMKDKYNVFIEVGPHPVLKNAMMDCMKNNEACHFLQTLNRKEPEQLNFFENIAALFTLGVPLKWERWVNKLPHLSLPSYPWQKEYYWQESNTSLENRIGRKGNVFLNQLINAPQLTYKVELNKYFFPFLNDHVVQDRVVFPGAGYVVAGIAFYQQEISQGNSFSLENIKFHQMLVLDDLKVQDLYTSYNSKNSNFSIDSKDVGDETVWVQRATGKFIIGDYIKSASQLDLKAISDRLNIVHSKEQIYERLSKSKLDYGPYFRTIKNIDSSKEESIAKIEGHAAIEHQDEFFIHPTLLDACFQSVVVFDESEFVPVSIGKIYCYFPPGTNFICYSRLISRSDSSVVIDMSICDEKGNVAIEIKDFKCQELNVKVEEEDTFIDDCLFENNWIEEKAGFDAIPDTTGVTYVFADDYSLCEPLLKQLAGRVVVIQAGTSFKELGENYYMVNPENLESILQIAENDFQSDITLIYLPADNQETNENLTVSEECLNQIKPLLNIVRFFSEKSHHKLTLNLITYGSQIVNEEDKITSITSTVSHGLGRLIVNELPKWQVRLIDFQRTDSLLISKEDWKIALYKIYSGKPFEEIAIRQDKIFRKGTKKREAKDSVLSLENVFFKDRSMKLVSSKSKQLEDLYFENTERAELKAGEIEILIENTSINFKDYLKVSGKIYSEALEGTYGKNAVGIDCAGIITQIGAGVTKFKVGDKVIALAAGTFQSYTTTPEHLAVKCPENLIEAESNIVLSYLTALYCLRDKANLGKGDRVLIHNAAGGVGLAAINYANLVGAEIYATTGSEEKMDYLRSIGINHVYSSRSLDFAKEILEDTQGKGVDVILSALPKEMLYQSLSILASYGTYLEIGKKDIIDNFSLSMHFFNKNISYIAVDMDRMISERPEKISMLLNDVSAYIKSGELKTLPVKVFTPKTISDGFQLIDEGNHIGKVVINFKDQFIDVKKQGDTIFKNDKTYVITGGTKGLGFEIGKWLVDNGVRNLALLSRSGLSTSLEREAVAEMEKKDVNVKVYAADVAEMDQMNNVFSQIENDLPEISSVFHCAMVLDDGFLIDMNEDRFRKVLKPKVDGAMNLHYLTKNLKLDNFVLFSSISSLIGNVGQANYIVANALLDSFAYVRKSQGLPATTINLGVLSESGVVSRSENLEMILQGVGIRSFTNKQVLSGLEKILHEKPTQIGFFDLNWELLSVNLKESGQFIFKDLIDSNLGSVNGLSQEQDACLSDLLSLTRISQQEFVVTFLKEELSKILKMPKDRIQSDKGIGFLGIDSILSIELLRVINNKFALKMSSMEILALPSVNGLSAIIIEMILKQVNLNVQV